MITLSSPAAIIVDESPLSLLTSRPYTPQYLAAWNWYVGLEAIGCRFYVPEIADYELRRELLRAGKTASLRRLDAFNAAEPGRYLPLTTPDVQEAARLWAMLRNSGLAGAPPEALDGDVLIAAQARRLPLFPGAVQVIVATANVSHLTRLTSAAFWSDIRT